MEVDNDLLRIVSYEHIKWGAAAQVKIKFQNVRTGAIYDRATTRAPASRRHPGTVQYLYHDVTSTNSWTPRTLSRWRWTRKASVTR